MHILLYAAQEVGKGEQGRDAVAFTWGVDNCQAASE